MALGAALAAGVVRAHRFEADLPDIVPDAPPALGGDVGDDRAFEPFTLAVIGPVRGDAATLERALQAARGAGAALTVVVGDAEPPRARDLAPLADVLIRHPGTVLLAGSHDASSVEASVEAFVDPFDDVDARLAALLTPPLAFDIRTRGCTVHGAERAVTLRMLATDRTWTLAVPPSEDDDDELVLELLHVRGPDRADRQTLHVARGASVSGVARELSLAALWPLGGSVSGLVAVLLAALATVTAGLRLARPDRRPRQRPARPA